jgi:hypothetical protein
MKRTILGLMLIATSPAASADVLAVCGASEGHSYYLPGGLVSKEDSGWATDGIKAGSFQLIRSGTDYDIIFTDASGGTLSARADGGHVIATPDASGNLLVLIAYPGKTLESYVFWFAIASEQTVTYSQAKYGTRLPKHSLLKASCKWERSVARTH